MSSISLFYLLCIFLNLLLKHTQHCCTVYFEDCTDAAYCYSFTTKAYSVSLIQKSYRAGVLVTIFHLLKPIQFGVLLHIREDILYIYGLEIQLMFLNLKFNIHI